MEGEQQKEGEPLTKSTTSDSGSNPSIQEEEGHNDQPSISISGTFCCLTGTVQLLC